MMDEQQGFSYLFGSNAPYIEELYENYLNDPNSVDEHWKQYFSELVLQPGAVDRDVAHRPIQESFANLAKSRTTAAAGAIDEAEIALDFIDADDRDDARREVERDEESGHNNAATARAHVN